MPDYIDPAAKGTSAPATPITAAEPSGVDVWTPRLLAGKS